MRLRVADLPAFTRGVIGSCAYRPETVPIGGGAEPPLDRSRSVPAVSLPHHSPEEACGPGAPRAWFEIATLGVNLSRVARRTSTVVRGRWKVVCQKYPPRHRFVDGYAGPITPVSTCGPNRNSQKLSGTESSHGDAIVSTHTSVEKLDPNPHRREMRQILVEYEAAQYIAGRTVVVWWSAEEATIPPLAPLKSGI